MKELDALIKALEERGVIRSAKFAISIAPFPKSVKTDEEKQELINKALKESLAEYFADDENEDVADLFGAYATELALNELVKKLDLKPSKDGKKEAVKSLFNEMKKLFEE